MNDRLGVRWGLAGGTTLATVDETRTAAKWAQQAGFDGFWVSQAMAVDPIVALAAIAADVPELTEVGTSVVPLYGRHPIGVAQQTMTAQSALGGRFTLGIGPSHARPVKEAMGMEWDRPYGLTAEFLDGLLPLLAGEPADANGSQLTTRAEVAISAPDTPVLLAALGTRMLKLAGQRCAGTTVGQCGPKTIANHVVPMLHAGAEQAGRTEPPRIMALVRVCVTDDHASAYALAGEVAAHYADLPSYAAVLEREGLDEPADLHLIGSWEQVLDGLGEYAAAGVTDLRVQITAPDQESSTESQEALAQYLSA